MIPYWLTIAIACLTILCPSGSAQGALREPLLFEQISIDQGLSQSSITALHQDDLGFIWLGTQEGLNRFDGEQFRVWRYQPQAPDGLASSSINALLQQGSHLWIGHDDAGLSVLDLHSGTIRRKPLRDGEASATMQQVDAMLSIDGVVYLSTLDGLWSFDSPTAAGTLLAWAQDAAEVTALWSQNGELHAASRDGRRWRLQGTQLQALSTWSVGVQQVLTDQQGRLWRLRADGGVDVRAADNFGDAAFAPSSLTTLAMIDGDVLAGSRAGQIYRLGADQDGVHFEQLTVGQGIGAPVTGLFLDRSDALWVGSYTGGAFRSKRLSGAIRHGLASFDDSEHFPSVSLRSFMQAASGDIWVGSDAGLVRYDSSMRQYQAIDLGRANTQAVRTMLADGQGGHWIGSQAGLWHRDASGTLREVEQLPDPRVMALARDRQQRLYVLTRAGAAIGRNSYPPQLKALPPTSGVSLEWTSATNYGDGILAGSNEHGLWLLRGNQAPTQVASTSIGNLVSDSVWAVHVNEEQEDVYLGLFGSGLQRLNTTGFKATGHWTTSEGLNNNVIYSILPGRDGQLWLSSNRGLNILDPATGDHVGFSRRDGLRNSEYNSGAAARLNDGRMLFGGISGLDVIDPRADGLRAAMDSPRPTAPVLTAVQLHGKSLTSASPKHGLILEGAVERAERLQLAANTSSLGLSLSDVDFNSGNRGLRYRLLGLNDDWIQLSSQQVVLSQLPPGRYRLQLQAVGANGQTSPIRDIELERLPRWWQSGPAVMGYALLIVGLIVAASLLAQRRRHQRARYVEELNAIVAERTRELKSLNSELQTSNQQLQEVTREDPLTRAFNRRELHRCFEPEQLATMADRRTPSVFYMIDIDHFKDINDDYGHTVGDEVLICVADRLRALCRPGDLLVRWGGEEFLLVIESLHPTEARHLAERVRRTIGAAPMQLSHERALPVKCSVGYANYPVHAESSEDTNWEDSIALADAALYVAKRSGRDCWVGVHYLQPPKGEELKRLQAGLTPAPDAEVLVYSNRAQEELVWRQAHMTE